MGPIQIIVPMSGFGERFRRAGYNVPKPLIELEGKPVIAHVADLFPGETDILFVCNQEHLDNPQYRMREVLEQYCPSGRVVGIAGHKRGPIHTVLQVGDLIDPARPVIVNYCDFTCLWDWNHFKRFVAECDCDGAIPAYRGFHPHSLGTTNYAYLREVGGWVEDIQEKTPFTDCRMAEYASSGTYYFGSGRLMQEAFSLVLERDLQVNGEYYVSLAFKPLLESGRRVAVYELQHFMQWGTPEDVAEYQVWSDAFRRLVDPNAAVLPPMERATTLIPMAGLGARFAQEGYGLCKALIPVSGRPMVLQAVRDLPASGRYIFVLRRDMPDVDRIGQVLHEAFRNAGILVLPGSTDGQARTALLGVQANLGDARTDDWMTIAACDSGALYRPQRLQLLLEDPETDLIVWVARGYPNAARHPHMYGWVACEEGTNRVIGVSVKAPLSAPDRDPIITGTFTFRRMTSFVRAVERMIARDARINGEFYIDACIEDALALGLNVRIFEIDSYLCWGTPNDLRTFEYWQSCFHKWPGHPYRLEDDRRVAPDALATLRNAYGAITPVPPAGASGSACPTTAV